MSLLCSGGNQSVFWANLGGGGGKQGVGGNDQKTALKVATSENQTGKDIWSKKLARTGLGQTGVAAACLNIHLSISKIRIMKKCKVAKEVTVYYHVKCSRTCRYAESAFYNMNASVILFVQPDLSHERPPRLVTVTKIL